MHAKSSQADPQKEGGRYREPYSQTHTARPFNDASMPSDHTVILTTISRHPQNKPTHTSGPYSGLRFSLCTFPLPGRAHLVSRGPNAGRRHQQQKEERERRERWLQRAGARPGPYRAPAATANADPYRPRVGAHGSAAAAAAAASRGFPGPAKAGQTPRPQNPT